MTVPSGKWQQKKKKKRFEVNSSHKRINEGKQTNRDVGKCINQQKFSGKEFEIGGDVICRDEG